VVQIHFQFVILLVQVLQLLPLQHLLIRLPLPLLEQVLQQGQVLHDVSCDISCGELVLQQLVLEQAQEQLQQLVLLVQVVALLELLLRVLLQLVVLQVRVVPLLVPTQLVLLQLEVGILIEFLILQELLQ